MKTLPTMLFAGLTTCLFACTNEVDMGDGRGPESSVQALSSSPTTYFVQGATSCPSIAGADGNWTGVRGQWTACKAFRSFDVDGCAYQWSARGKRASDVDALALTLGPLSAGLFQSPMPPTTGGPCPHDHPSPGAVPCGACQIGIATPTYAYITLPAPLPVETSLVVQNAVHGQVLLTAPANQTFFVVPGAFGNGFALGEPLYPLESDD